MRCCIVAIVGLLHRQNGWLRRNIQIEGESIAALPASSGLRKTMETYNARLLAAVGHNDKVLHTLFGAPPSFEWPWAAWQWPCHVQTERPTTNPDD